MEAKLIKTGNDYLLRDMNGEVLAITNGTTKGRKLSKQNCDEIFGVVDVEKLCKQEAEKLHDKSKHEDWDVYNCLVYEDTEMIKIGFNKAMELNKYKVFTLEDVKKSIEMAREENGLSDNTMSYDYSEDEIIQSIQQPSEIEVEIEMKLNMNGKNAIERSMYIPKLDSEGCLILKKI
jgi:hypothetical protein